VAYGFSFRFLNGSVTSTYLISCSHSPTRWSNSLADVRVWHLPEVPGLLAYVRFRG